MTPTPISSDIPNKVCAAPALAGTDAENTAVLSQARPVEGGGEEKKKCVQGGRGQRGIGGWGRRPWGITVQKICDL